MIQEKSNYFNKYTLISIYALCQTLPPLPSLAPAPSSTPPNKRADLILECSLAMTRQQVKYSKNLSKVQLKISVLETSHGSALFTHLLSPQPPHDYHRHRQPLHSLGLSPVGITGIARKDFGVQHFSKYIFDSEKFQGVKNQDLFCSGSHDYKKKLPKKDGPFVFA